MPLLRRLEGDEHDDHDDHDDHDEEEEECHCGEAHPEDELDEHDEHGEEEHHDEDGHNSTNTTTPDAHDEHDEHAEHCEAVCKAKATKQTDPATKTAWGEAMAGAIIVNLTTLFGVFMVPVVLWGTGKDFKLYSKAATNNKLTVSLSAFAAGAILSSALFLLLPEAISLLSAGMPKTEEGEDAHAGHDDHRFRLLATNGTGTHDDHDEHAGESADEHAGHTEIPTNVVVVWGVSILAGFVFAYMADLCCHVGFPNLADANAKDEKTPSVEGSVVGSVVVPAGSDDGADDAIVVAEEGLKLGATPVPQGGFGAGFEAGTSADMLEPDFQARNRLICSVLIGDFCHNICDGFFIGSAFLNCPSMGWGIVLATVAHELPQELSDFYLLTSYGALPVWKALLYNFLSGTSVLIGAIIVLSANVSDTVLGVLLALGGGVYLQVGASECMVRAARLSVTVAERLIMTALFTVGAVLIGLVLLNHNHCE